MNLYLLLLHDTNSLLNEVRNNFNRDGVNVVVVMLLLMLGIHSNALIFFVEYETQNALKMIAQKQQTGHRVSKWLCGSGDYHFIIILCAVTPVPHCGHWMPCGITVIACAVWCVQPFYPRLPAVSLRTSMPAVPHARLPSH